MLLVRDSGRCLPQATSYLVRRFGARCTVGRLTPTWTSPPAPSRAGAGSRAAVGRAVWDTEPNSAPSAWVGDHRMEVTTFRADSYDRVSRHPEVRFGDCLEGVWSPRLHHNTNGCARHRHWAERIPGSAVAWRRCGPRCYLPGGAVGRWRRPLRMLRATPVRLATDSR